MSAPLLLSPQEALISMLQTDIAATVVLKKSPVRFEDLPQVASKAGLRDAEVALKWLYGAQPSGGKDAVILVAEREQWLYELKQLPARRTPFPEDLIVALTIDVPWAQRCFVVPTSGRPADDQVMLYATRPVGDAAMLLPIAATRGSSEVTELPQPCNPLRPPSRGCISTGCLGTCEPGVFFEGDFLVNHGCICT